MIGSYLFGMMDMVFNHLITHDKRFIPGRPKRIDKFDTAEMELTEQNVNPLVHSPVTGIGT